MKKRWTMRRALLVLCIASVVFALLLQTFLFHQSLRRQIRAESISDHEISLNKMQTDLSNFIHTIRGEMLTIYSEQDLIAAMREAAEKDTDMKDYYWRSWYFARKRFTKEDQLLAMYLYDTKDHLISSYRYNSVTYPKDIYKAEYDDNSERVYDYVHGKRTDLMISGYHNSAAKKDIVRFVLKLPSHSPQFMVWGYIFLSQPQLRITFSNFPTKYRLDEPLFPFWHPDNLSAMPFWLFLAILILPYLYRTYKPLFFLLGSVYLVTIMYIARGLPIFYADNLLDVYQPLDVALHLSMLIGSYAALELLFYQQHAFHFPLLLTRSLRIALLGAYFLLFINTCFTTTYVRRTFVAGAYMESLFHYNLNETMRQSSRLYVYAFRHLWR